MDSWHNKFSSWLMVAVYMLEHLFNIILASPSTRRRRISVKSTHIRKQSVKAVQPRQRRLTVSTSTFNNRSPTVPHRQVTSLYSPRLDADGITSAVIPSRRLSVAVGRKPSNVSQKRPQRRSSEPFLLDPLTLQNKLNRKYSTTSRAYGRRRVSTTATLPTSSKQKLQALAKDELLASLNVPLSRPDLTTATCNAETIDEPSVDESEEQKQQHDKERKEVKRLLIIEEILETEKNYISCLETLNIVFRTQLENTNIITDKDLMSLFPSHLSEIKTSHTWFMKELEDRMHHDDWRGIIGDIFAKMTSASANLLEIYTCYVNAFPKSISTLSKCTRSSQKFRKFLEDCYENPLVERLDLPSFLLSPVQRLPRYILLLRELLKYTNEEHPDHYFIGEAMKEMEALISSLNDSIQNSMEFYSASEGRRKKMSRQFTSKKRKQRSSQISRIQKKMVPLNEARSTDFDQGYCSFSERKDESPEDETSLQRKSRSSTWRNGVTKRSMSMISSSSEENKNNMVVRRKPEFSRNGDTRKSWRRSLGAVFSQIWSKEESNSREQQRRESAVTYSPNVSEDREDINIVDKSKSADNISAELLDVKATSKASSVKRKVAVTHAHSNEKNQNEDENIEQISNLIRDSSLKETNTPMSTVSIEVSSINSSSTSIDGVERRNSIESNQSNNSLKTPGSPQLFKRDKLRGSAGPVFKSIFNKSKLSQKTLSWDELNIDRTDSHLVSQPDKKHKRYSISLRRPKLIKQEHTKELKPLTIEKSFSTKSLNEELGATSSTETISSHTSTHSNMREEDNVELNISDNNNNDHLNKGGKEKKHKFMKTLRNFVGKSK